MNLHFLFLLCSLIPRPAFATSFYIRPMSEFTQSAPHIIRGIIRSTRVEDQSDSSGNRVILTYGEVEVKEVLKGSITESRISIRKAGGEKNGVSLEIPGSPEFRENEETVLFLGEIQADHSYEIFDMELGKFTLSHKDGHDYLKGGLLAYSEKPQDEGVGPGLKANHRDWSIEDLKSLIQSQGGTPRTAPLSPQLSPQRFPSPLPTPTPETASSFIPLQPQGVSTPTPASFTPSPMSSEGKIALGLGLLFALGLLLYRKTR